MIAVLALAAAAVVFAVISVRSPRKCAECGRRGDLTRDEGSRLWYCRSVSRCWGPAAPRPGRYGGRTTTGPRP